MKKYLLACAVCLLIGAGCAQTPRPAPPSPANETPVTTPQPEPAPEPRPLSEDPAFGPSYKANAIVVDELKVGDVVASPLTVSGKALGGWFFEASFPVRLVDANGKLVANGAAQAQGDWMTTGFVPFKIALTFGQVETATGMLVFAKDNPSGLPQNDDRMELPVRFISHR